MSIKVLHTLGGFTAAGGGVTTCLYHLLNALSERDDIDARLLTILDPKEPLYGDGTEKWIDAVKRDYITPLALSRNLSQAIKKTNADIYHVNGLWMHVNHLTAAHARASHKPYVISPHGMLHPDALRRSSWKKKPLLALWFKRDILQADAIHATSGLEAQSVRDFGYTGRIEIIPNPIPVPEYIDSILSKKSSLIDLSPRSIGFMGRIHPVKGIDCIIRGVAKAKSKDIRLKIIGTGETAYVDELHRLAEQCGASDRIEWIGHVDGERKYELLASLSALFVTSDFENFGMIVPESLLVETPVMAGLETPWQMLETERCGWWSERAPESVAKIIDYVATAPIETLRAMGSRGRHATLSQFSPAAVAAAHTSLYQSLTSSL